MEYAFLGRISRPYSEISDLFIDWSKQCRLMWVYQHDADEKVNRTHCHFLCIGSRADREKLRERQLWKSFKLKGNGDFAMKAYNPIYEYQNIVYQSKGNLEPMLAVGENANEIANECRLKWVIKSIANDNVNTDNVVKKARQTEYDIQLMIEELLWPMNTDLQPVSKDDIYTKTIEVLEREHKFAHYQRVARLCQAIRIRFHPADAKRTVMNMF